MRRQEEEIAEVYRECAQSGVACERYAGVWWAYLSLRHGAQVVPQINTTVEQVLPVVGEQIGGKNKLPF